MRVTLVLDKEQNCYKAVSDDNVTYGVGNTPDVAMEDARRNIQRPPERDLDTLGSPTWSLKSDEPFWKGRKDEKAIR